MKQFLKITYLIQEKCKLLKKKLDKKDKGKKTTDEDNSQCDKVCCNIFCLKPLKKRFQKSIHANSNILVFYFFPPESILCPVFIQNLLF